MDTKILRVNDSKKDTGPIDEAARLIQAGEVVAFPTETVYGLGGNARDPIAIQKIFAAKERPADNPLIVHIAQTEDLDGIADEVNNNAKKLMEKFWPGPLSLVLKKHVSIPNITTAGLGTVVVRLPRHSIAQALIRAAGVPIAAPSANRSGRLSPTRASHVIKDLDGRIPLIIDGDDIEYGLESTIVDCTIEPPTILRPGSVTLEQLQSIVPNIYIADTTHPLKSPGMKYRHYSPTAPIILFCGEPEKTAIAMKQHAKESSANKTAALWHTGDTPVVSHTQKLPRAAEQAAPLLFSSLRLIDKPNVSKILVQGYSEAGVGAAIMNRLRKAASSIVEI